MRGKGIGIPASGTNGLIADSLLPLPHLLIVPLDFCRKIDNDGARIRFGERGPNPVGPCSFFIESGDSRKGGAGSQLQFAQAG
jgi:hypothetical protein